ncbi:MAG: hypothetical protein LC627_03020, partial [Verrucomicrobiaceae bacterium]|nr:hypothetical protein [Verrucomicrobiaceae bacterium]
MNAQQVADIFVEQRVLQTSQAEDVLQEAILNGKNIEQALIDSGFVDERGFYQVIADALGTDFVELPHDDITPEILRLIPGGLARLHRALPIAVSDNTLTVALVDPLDLRAAEDLRFALGKDVHVVVAPFEQVEERIKRHYGTDSSSMEDILKQLGETGELLSLRGTDQSESAVEADANA